ncbi:MAG: hypothetical protein AAF742_05485 [Pseudomonadota bacterium]
MGLIEKIAASETTAPAHLSVGGDGGHGPSFTLDFDDLAAKGAFTVERFGRDHVLELRAIKRALLKRIGLLHAATARRRGVGTTRGRQRNIVVVTSSRPGEGKTFTSVNLALSLALEDRKSVLLVDGDAVRPKVRSYFDLPRSAGLTDRLADPSQKLPSILWRAENAPLSVLTEGTKGAEASDLYNSEGARAFFAGVSTAAPDRIVIIDAPPALATTEAYALAQHADEVLFVVQSDATPEPAVAVALDEILEASPSVSLVLNRCAMAGGGHHYDSYDNYYAREAGKNDA